ncbi:MAG TPA: hypothetical protein VNB90_15440 [Cytophagaceae bacterium]|nr:hypothetical protein [Cytophagaceae bacterium]
MSEKTEFTPENKFRWISKMYFSVSDSPVHDVNPFDDMEPFLKAKVGDMDWGTDKAKSKEKFVKYLSNIFELYDFNIPKPEILKSLENEKQTNSDFITHLASIGIFPKN